MLKLYIRRQVATLNTEIYIVREEPGMNFGYHFNEEGQCIETSEQYVRGMISTLKPSMILPEHMVRELIQAFADHAKAEGVRFGTEDINEGKLIATERHLEDMRKLVFENKK